MHDIIGKTGLNPQYVTVVVAAFLPIFASIPMFTPVGAMIRHFANDPEAATKVPLMVTAPGLAIAILSPFARYLVDRFGRRRLLLCCTVFYGIFGVLPVVLNDLNLIFATLLASGVILLSGMTAAKHWNAGFLVYLVEFPIFAAMLAYLFEPSRRAPLEGRYVAALSEAFPVRSAAIVAAETLFVSTFHYVYIVNGSPVLQEIGIRDPGRIAQIAFVPSLFIMAGAAMFRVLTPLLNKAQIATTLAFLGVGLATIGVARSVPLLLVALAVQQTGAGMAVPTLIAWAETKFPFQHRGRGMGMWCSCFQFISPLVVRVTAQAFGSIARRFSPQGASRCCWQPLRCSSASGGSFGSLCAD